jgi:hypothetical protein
VNGHRLGGYQGFAPWGFFPARDGRHVCLGATCRMMRRDGRSFELSATPPYFEHATEPVGASMPTWLPTVAQAR